MRVSAINHLANSIYNKFQAFALKGHRYYCPICEKSFRKFLKSGVIPRQNARCPSCHSLERHRLFWVALCHLQQKGEIKWGGKLLHIAPEDCLAEKFMQKYDYLSIDLDDRKAMLAMDITAMTFEDETFDAIVCNHVLEHIPDDRKAIKELHRVLKPSGWASIQVPMKGELTQEDLSISNPVERTKLYGQRDHVRYYGYDFINRLGNAGFQVQQISKNELLKPEELERISVGTENEVVLCKKI